MSARDGTAADSVSHRGNLDAAVSRPACPPLHEREMGRPGGARLTLHTGKMSRDEAVRDRRDKTLSLPQLVLELLVFADVDRTSSISLGPLVGDGPSPFATFRRHS